MVSAMGRSSHSKGKRLRGATEEKVESYFPEKIYRLRGRSRMISASGIVDSGASWIISGLPWVKKWSILKTADDWKKCVTSSTRRFRFGDSRLFCSLGSILLNAFLITEKEHRAIYIGN